MFQEAPESELLAIQFQPLKYECVYESTQVHAAIARTESRRFCMPDGYQHQVLSVL